MWRMQISLEHKRLKDAEKEGQKDVSRVPRARMGISGALIPDDVPMDEVPEVYFGTPRAAPSALAPERSTATAQESARMISSRELLSSRSSMLSSSSLASSRSSASNASSYCSTASGYTGLSGVSRTSSSSSLSVRQMEELKKTIAEQTKVFFRS
jgi:hypothetical protein